MPSTIRVNGEWFFLSSHAALRMAQRNLTLADVRDVLTVTSPIPRAGARFFFLRRVDLLNSNCAGWSRLEGSTVVVCKRCNRILTVWRNRKKGLRYIKRKAKREALPASCPHIHRRYH